MMPSDLSMGLVSLLGGGLTGYVQGRKDRAQREQQQEEIRKRDEQIRKKEESRIEEINRKREGEAIFTNLLKTIAGVSPQTPYSEVQKIKTMGLEAAMQAGYDLRTAAMLFDQASAVPAPEVVDPLTQAKIDTEGARQREYDAQSAERYANAAQTKAETQKIRNDIGKTARSMNASDPNQLTDEELVKAIGDAQKRLDATVDESGEVFPEYEKSYRVLQSQVNRYAEVLQRRQPPQPPEGIRRPDATTQYQPDFGNPASLTPARRAAAPQQQGQQQLPTAVNPQTGERLVYKDGKWQPIQ